MAYYPWPSGDAGWSMYDYNRGCCDIICLSGVADIFRISKFSVPFFKSQVEVGTLLPSGLFKPYIFLASFWERPTPENKIVVYSNVEEVSLSINGKEIARQKPDSGSDTEYASKKEMWYKGGNSFDGGNCKQLGHPPFTFINIVWQAGEITAIGYINNNEVCRNTVRTPGQSSQLAVSYFKSGKPATKNDLLIVYVNIEDENSTLCVSDSTLISLSVIKGGEVIGPSEIKSEAGIASFLVKTDEEEELVLKAKSSFNETEKVIPLSR
jgi:beta-galactosidase